MDNLPSSDSSGGTPAVLPAGKFWGIVVAGCLSAGLVAFIIGEFTHKAFIAPKVLSDGPGTRVMAPTFEGLVAAGTKNALLTYTATALVFGLFAGFAGGISAGSMRSALLSGAVGAILGGVVTGLVTKGAMFLYFRELEAAGSDSLLNLFVPFLVHASIGAAIGLISAIAYALGARVRGQRFTSVVIHGMLGGVIGAAFFELIGGQLFPLSRTDYPIADFWAARLFGVLAVALAGFCFAAAAVRSKPKT